ncbi:T9SS type A sorting domain-containing protein [Panacibacter ginsenosidivorans]|nr:T9SS type A sorting domain-containing protein [Panacibacter ginsenosidivorans]
MKKTILVYIMTLVTLSAISQWTVDSLNSPRANIPVAVFGNKMVFGAGTGINWDVFDFSTNTHTSGSLSFNRTDIKFAQAGTNAYYAGGKYGPYTDPLYTKNVDIYNSATNTWSVAKLSLARLVGGAGSISNKVFFAGGLGRDFGGPVYIYNRVDIFNASTGLRTTAKLSKARSNIAVGSAADKILFAGGWYWDIMYNQLQTNVVDIYNNTTGIWSKALLSKKREEIGVAVVGNKILFAGGYTSTGTSFASKNVDIYDALTNTWTNTNFSVGRYDMAIAVVGTKAYFAGGGGADNSIEVYDVAMGTWTNLTMPVSLKGYTATVVGDKIYYAGGYDVVNRASSIVQVYNTTTQTWSIDALSQPRYGISAVSLGNKAVFAGGYKDFAYPLATTSNRIDIYSQSLFAANASSEIIKNTNVAGVYPNPAKTYIIITTGKTIPAQSEISIIDLNGNIKYKQVIKDITEPIKLFIASLATGMYYFKINSEKEIFTGSFIKE